MALLEKRKRAARAPKGCSTASAQEARCRSCRASSASSPRPTGAVIRDILHRLADRCPTHVVVWPVKVQGEGAAAQVAAAVARLRCAARDGAVPRPDLLIVARGGGSIEDLWAFNEEVVVRAVADCSIPLISAVGHETDTTLCDFAADLRAPTPTAAAEIAVPVRADLRLSVARHAQRTERCARRYRRARPRAAGRRWRGCCPSARRCSGPSASGRRCRRSGCPRAGAARDRGARRARPGGAGALRPALLERRLARGAATRLDGGVAAASQTLNPDKPAGARLCPGRARGRGGVSTSAAAARAAGALTLRFRRRCGRRAG